MGAKGALVCAKDAKCKAKWMQDACKKQEKTRRENF